MKYFIILFLFIPVLLFSQEQDLTQNKNLRLKGVIFKHEYSVEAKLNTLGFALAFNKGKIISYHTTKYYHFEIGYLKSFKEKKGNLVITGLNIYNKYSYGKRNYFFPVRLGLGKKEFLSEKDTEKGLAVGYSLEGGVDFGILKPYYLKVKSGSDGNNTFLETIRYSEENHGVFIDENLIYDRGPFFKGFNHLSFVPGIHINTAAHFAINAYERTLFAFETGMLIDAYIKRIPIMVETASFKNNFIFINVYINVQFGRRWN